MAERPKGVLTWCLTVTTVGAALAGVFAYGSGHTLWHRVLFVVVVAVGIPAFAFLLGAGLYDAIIWLVRKRARSRASRPIVSRQSRSPIGTRKPFPSRIVLGGLITCSLLAGGILLADHALGGSVHPNASPSAQPSATHSSVRQSRHPGAPSGRPEAVLAEPGSNEFSVTAMVFSPDDRTLATANNDSGSIYLWNLSTGTRTATLTDPGDNGVNAIAFSPDGKTLAAADEDGSTYLWNLSTRTLAATLPYPGPGGPSQALAMDDAIFSPDGSTFITIDQGGGAYLWNLASRRVTATLINPATGPFGATAAAFSPDGKTLAISDYGGNTYLWNVATLTRTATVRDPGGNGVQDVAFNPSGGTFAAIDVYGNTYLWNLATLTRVDTFAGTTRTIGGDAYIPDALAFSPDGKVLVAGNQSGSVLYLWNLVTGKHIATLSDPGSTYTFAVAFSPDGKTLAAYDSLGHINLWNVNQLDL